MKGVEGNEALIARQPIDTPAGKRWVPFLSGNALRHRLIREPGALWLIEMLRLKGELTLKQFNFLNHGGNLTESTGREDTARIAEMQELFPLLRLLGGSLPDQILKGSLLPWPGMLLCEENRQRLPLSDGFELPVESLRPAEHYVEGFQYTRGDGAKRPDWYDHETRDPDAKSNLMIFSGQQVIAGAVFIHGFDIPHGSELELGALLHSLSLWQETGGTIGGMGARGHGRLNTHILGAAAGHADAVAGYVEHVAANAERCRQWIAAVFAAKEPKPKSKKAAAEASDA